MARLLFTVVDEDMDLPIPGVEVQVSATDGGAWEPRTLTTSSEGEVSVEVPPGSYEASFTKPGFGGVMMTAITAQVARTFTYTLVMSPESRDEVRVVATGKVLTKNFLKRLPAGRSYQRSVAIAPGIPGTFSVSGRRARAAGRVASRIGPAVPEDGRSAYGASTAAPTIRAGMTDDNLDFHAFTDFLRASQFGGRVDPVEIGDRRRIYVVDRNGEAIPNARIEVLDWRRDHVVWRAETYGDGAANFYATDLDVADRPLLVQVRHGDHWESQRWDGSEDLTLVLDKARRDTEVLPLDVVLVIDTTGSMSDEFEAIKATLLAVTEQTRQLQRPVDLRWGAVLYRDRGDAYITRRIDLTGDADAFAMALRRARANGGGDTPESLNQALNEAVQDMDWRRDGARVAFVVADAEPQMQYQEKTYADAAREALRDGIRIHTVAASGLSAAGTYVYRQIAQLTRGKFIYIDYGLGTAASHGITGQPSGNNLDVILADRIREEVERFGRTPSAVSVR